MLKNQEIQKNHFFEDKFLLEKIKNEDDQDAFEVIFYKYYAGLVVYANQFVFDKAESEDIVQEFFTKLWQKRQYIELTDTIKSYFFSSIKNSCLNHLKQKSIHEKYIQWLNESSKDRLDYNEDLYTESELKEKIKKTIDLLPNRCREVFILSKIKGEKNDKIAEELNISKRTVETHISNAIKVLKEQLKEYLILSILLVVISILFVIL
jgi:RNA polymerase sigma-70 factor (ECF subfamily)